MILLQVILISSIAALIVAIGMILIENSYIITDACNEMWYWVKDEVHGFFHLGYFIVEIRDAPNCSHYINGLATDSIPVTVCTKCNREVW